MAIQNKVMTWSGWIIAGLISAMLIFSAGMKFARPPEMIEQFTGKLGYPENTVVPIGVVEITCLLLFLIPQTAVLGAVLLTGYLGGAVATHVRVSDPFVPPIIAGVLVWLSLFLRDPRVRALLPLRRSMAAGSDAKRVSTVSTP